MNDEIRFIPQQLYEVAADVEVWADDLRTVGSDVDGALEAFRSSSSEFAPNLPAHGTAIGSGGDLMVVLAESVAALGAAAEEADRQGIDDFRQIVLAVAGGIRMAGTVTGPPQNVLRLIRTSVHGTRAVSSGARLWRINRRYGSRPMPDIAKIRALAPGGNTMPRHQARELVKSKYRELKKTRRPLLRANYDSRHALHTNRPLSRYGRGVRNFMTNTRTGRLVSTGGRVLGGAGTVLAGVDTVNAIYEGDTERAVTSGLSTVGGALMMTANPVGVTAGAVIVTGVLIYENWDTISDWGEGAVDAVGDLGSSVVEGAGKLFDSIF
ncbi:MAG: hypothetical protein ACRDU8_05405 [Egibacteraceae bacterium]